MANSTQTNKDGDNDELEALFDSIVGTNDSPENTSTSEIQKSDETVSEEAMMAAMMGEQTLPSKGESTATSPPATTLIESERGNAIFESIGHLTRQLHETMRELGFDKSMERLATELPDARDRLEYVSKMTEQAAEKVLNATDSAQPIQNKLGKDAATLDALWENLLNRSLPPQDGGEQLKVLVHNTRQFLGRVSTDSDQTNKYLMDIVMAQDFQDLTGQVIKKITATAADLEARMVEILVQFTPLEKREEIDSLHGPQINATGKADVAADQQQVDDLLASLGF